ncbi:hypothetical protein MMC11_001094 [Xylographa trunciseda]|nr:hypothetical protein [Xylographa trunciseda]
MPPSSRKRPSPSYESDNGFVASDDEPRSKKPKTEKKKTAPKLPNPTGNTTQAGAAVAGGGGGCALDAHGDEFWELTSTRRVVVSKFGGKVMVSVREYYEKDGQSLPGKKVRVAWLIRTGVHCLGGKWQADRMQGISMPVAQFSDLVALLPHIETVLKAKGETLRRPEYDKGGAGGGGGGEEEEDDDAEVMDEDVGRGKKNFEATSEEDE